MADSKRDREVLHVVRQSKVLSHYKPSQIRPELRVTHHLALISKGQMGSCSSFLSQVKRMF